MRHDFIQWAVRLCHARRTFLPLHFDVRFQSSPDGNNSILDIEERHSDFRLKYSVNPDPHDPKSGEDGQTHCDPSNRFGIRHDNQRQEEKGTENEDFGEEMCEQRCPGLPPRDPPRRLPYCFEVVCLGLSTGIPCLPSVGGIQLHGRESRGA